MKSLLSYLPESFLRELADAPVETASPLSGAEAESKTNPANSMYGTRELSIDDPVTVKHGKYQGKHGKVVDMHDDKIIVSIPKVGTKQYTIADIEYNDYTGAPDKDDSFKRELNNLRKMAGYE